jgi:transposase-like protein
MAYSFKKKRYCVRQALLGLIPIREICRNRKVPKTTLYRWLEDYKKGGWDALKEGSAGVPALEINPDFEKIVVDFLEQT